MASVEEPVDIHLITDEWYNREVEKVKKSEILANKAAAAKKKLAAGLAPIQTSYPASETLPAKMPAQVIPAGQFLNPDDPTAKNLATGLAPVPFRLGKKTAYQESIDQQIEDKINEKLGLSDIKGLSSDAFMLLNNPLGGIGKLLGALGPEALVAVLGVQFAASVAQQVFKMYSDQFGAGGWFDTRNLVLDQTREMAPINTLLDIGAGQVYFSDDAGMGLKQRAPESANTRTLRDGQARYNLLTIGDGVSS